jgi:hypothetical protein
LTEFSLEPAIKSLPHAKGATANVRRELTHRHLSLSVSPVGVPLSDFIVVSTVVELALVTNMTIAFIAAQYFTIC